MTELILPMFPPNSYPNKLTKLQCNEYDLVQKIPKQVVPKLKKPIIDFDVHKLHLVPIALANLPYD